MNKIFLQCIKFSKYNSIKYNQNIISYFNNSIYHKLLNNINKKYNIL